MICTFYGRCNGQDLIEYTLLMCFIALAAAAIFVNASGRNDFSSTEIRGTKTGRLFLPERITDKRKYALDIESELNRLLALPPSVQSEASIKRSFKLAFDTIPDKEGACDLVFEALLAVHSRSDYASAKLAKELGQYLNSSGTCRQQFENLLAPQ